jgi:hypothetical protein
MEYTFFGLRDKAEYSALQKALLELRNDNTKGPKLPIELERSDAMVVDDSRASEILEIARMTATERCMNYSQSQCESAMNECGSNIPFGLSQVTMLCDEMWT